MEGPKKETRSTSFPRLQIRERLGLLVLGDVLMGVISLVLALIVWGSRLRFIKFDLLFLSQRVPLWFYLLPFLWLLLQIELYDFHRASRWRDTVRGVASAAGIGFMVYLVVYFSSRGPGGDLPRVGVAAFIVFAAVLTLLWRRIYIHLYTSPALQRRVLVVGGGRAGAAILRVINELRPPPFYVVGVMDDDPQKENSKIEGYPVLGASDRLLDIVRTYEVTDVFVSISGQIEGQMFQALLGVQAMGVAIIRMPRAYEDLLSRVPIRYLEADWILRSFVDTIPVGSVYDLVKRLVDILGAVIGLLVLGIFLPFIAAGILLDDGWPIFYAQTRLGRNGKPFGIVKLRTMIRDAELNGRPQWAKEHDARTTRTGRFLRKTHLDELPQFWNVLLGDMSLVGPRAERPKLVDMFEKHVPFYRARLLVKPGITGWAQVNYGYASTVEETMLKLEYDLYYIKHRSIWMDILIILRTPATVLGFRGR